VSGDSAGGNLAAAVALKCVQESLRRPDGVVLFYPVLSVEVAVSPSRLISLMDPMLPQEVLLSCLEAYVIPSLPPPPPTHIHHHTHTHTRTHTHIPPSRMHAHAHAHTRTHTDVCFRDGDASVNHISFALPIVQSKCDD
jgi:acetyl esterase/lipase